MNSLRFLFSVAFLCLVSSTAAMAADQTAVFAGGCFWGVEAVFEHVKGVKDVRSGYSGGTKETANYDTVSFGTTKHAEVVEIKFDDAVVPFETLLYIFFTVAHDPTEVDRQGPDVGPQYRSAVFYLNDKQKASADAFIKTINDAKIFTKPVATQVVKSDVYYNAEDYHQDFLKKNPEYPYIVYHDMPKLADLRKKFPEFWVDKYGMGKRL